MACTAAINLTAAAALSIFLFCWSTGSFLLVLGDSNHTLMQPLCMVGKNMGKNLISHGLLTPVNNTVNNGLQELSCY
jgi:hypothetical protein